MRAPLLRRHRPRSRRAGDGLPAAAAIGAVALAATATLGLGGPASSTEPPRIEVLGNGTFTAPLEYTGTPTGWLCQQNVLRSYNQYRGYWLEGSPAADELAWCTQRVAVLPNSTYTLSADVRGPYVFLGTEGGGPGETVQSWSNDPDWNLLTVTVTTGPDASSLLVRLHGWYGQAPYQVKRVSMVGPGVLPTWCAPRSPGSSPSTPPPSAPPSTRTNTASPGSTANDTVGPYPETPNPTFNTVDPCPDQY
ncbi:hypothetical protein [Kitasatospora sp. NPDC004272]